MRIWRNEDAWTGIYQRVGQAEGVEPALAMGLTAMESAFDPRAYRQEPAIYTGPGAKAGEHVASWGLMQTTQGAAVEGGWPAGQPFAKLLEPETSILYGTRELKRYLANPMKDAGRFPGVPVEHVNPTADAVAAYNMGLPRSIRGTTAYIATLYAYPFPGYKDKPPADWHYANEPYVRRVLTYAEYFRAKMAGRADLAAAIAADINKHAYHVITPAQASGAAAVVVLLLALAGGAWWASQHGGRASA